MRTSACRSSGYAQGRSASEGARVRASVSPSTQPWLGGTVRPSPGNRTCTRVAWTKSAPVSTSMSVPAGMSTVRLPVASNADQRLPDLALFSHTAGGSTPPTSLALTQPTPGWRVSASPEYWTNNQSGRLSTCLSVVHCGKRVKRTESSVGPDHNPVSVRFLTHWEVRSDLTESSKAWPAGVIVGTTTGCGVGTRGTAVGASGAATAGTAAAGAATTAPAPAATTGKAAG